MPLFPPPHAISQQLLPLSTQHQSRKLTDILSFPILIHFPPALCPQTPVKVFSLYTRPHPIYLLLSNAAIEASQLISFLLFSISQQSIRNKSSLSSYKLGAGKMVKLLRVLVHKHKNLNSIHNTPVKNHVHGHKSSTMVK